MRSLTLVVRLLDEREHAIAVELRLPHPVGVVKRFIAQLGLHRRERRGQFLGRTGNDQPLGRDAMRRHTLHLLDRCVGKHRAVLLGQISLRDKPILVLDQQPVLAVRHAHQRERSFDLFAAQQKAQLAVFEFSTNAVLGLRTIVKRILLAFIGRVDAAVPHDHFTRAVLPGRNDALERRIVKGMVFGLRGQTLIARIERRPLRNGPRFQYSVALQPQVVVHVPRGVLLNHEQQRPAVERRVTRAAGSGVAEKLRLAEYSVSWLFFTLEF